ncbi:M23 family metallopeptidase [Bdellovibrio sp. 22V]|uniref:M23 family metallopeptidase n=1 Tax=Bdellovibrio TaxID=958 RepID=UPI002542ADE7|nr:M23 family metallopeptidase [Bdellovibrio sp. 22V]WII71034.1 M23 family metallopeptidase [Bdellovibrio sp. 22V]
MTPGWNQLVKLAGSIFLVGALGSCATFHTPLSREYFAPGNNTPRVTASDHAPTIEKEMSFDWPVDRARMTRGFLPNKKRPHLGIDLAAPKGTPILASQSGTVIYAGREFRGYGKMVLVESGEGWATLYAHFDKILVSEGQKVRQGEVIGAMGRTGRATGVHLHFEIRKNKGPIDPLPLLPQPLTAGL